MLRENPQVLQPPASDQPQPQANDGGKFAPFPLPWTSVQGPWRATRPWSKKSDLHVRSYYVGSVGHRWCSDFIMVFMVRLQVGSVGQIYSVGSVGQI